MILAFVSSAALTADGTVWTWGSNADCQLGLLNPAPSTDESSEPQPVAGPAAATGKFLSTYLRHDHWSMCEVEAAMQTARDVEPSTQFR